MIGHLLDFVAPLAGVLVGGAIAVRTQSSALVWETRMRLRTEKREAYLRFVAAARSWQSIVLNPEVAIKGPSVYAGRKYADAGPAYAESIRALAEVHLVGGAAAIEGAERWDDALRALSHAIAQPDSSARIQEAVRVCHSAEAAFAAAARDDVDRFANRPSRLNAKLRHDHSLS